MNASQQQTNPPVTIKYASVGRRFLAFVIDNAIISIALYFVLYRILGIDFLKLVFAEHSVFVKKISDITFQSNILFYVTLFAYQFIFLAYSSGATIGQKLLRLRVIKANGNPINLLTIVIRYIIGFISGIVLSLGHAWAIFDPKKQTWHDKASGTIVLESDTKPNVLVVILTFLFAMFVQISLFSVSFYKSFTYTVDQINAEKKSVQTKEGPKWANPEVEKLYNKSQDLFDNMRLNGANKEKVIALNDENIALLKKALEQDPENSLLWFNLSAAYTWLSTEGTIEDGLIAAKRAYDADPTQPQIIENYGTYLVMNKQYDAGVIQLRKSIRMQESAIAYEYLGKAYGQLGLYDESIASYRKAIEQHEKYNKNGAYDSNILSDQKSIGAIERVKSGQGTLQE